MKYRLPEAVLTSPVIVQVHSFRPAEEGETAKPEVREVEMLVPDSLWEEVA